MANEYLKRTPTSTGNRRVFTWSGWVKKNEIDTGFGRLFEVGANTSNRSYFTFRDGDELEFVHRDSGSITDQLISDYEFKDPGSFAHFMIAANSTASSTGNRIKIYVNGVLLTGYSTSNLPSANQEFDVNSLVGHYLGNSVNQAADLMGSMSDVFFIDGQALTPDVFGFYKDGKGYQSSGSTQATDFRPGQWSPHSPRKIKSEIERRGGFGVNGFYLPMNDSSNVGADFHCTPNSIIKLKGEDLPQPRNGAPTTSDAYVSQLRQEEGSLGFDGVIKFDGSGDYLSLADNADCSFDGDFTIEAFVYPTAFNSFNTIFSTEDLDFKFISSGAIRIYTNSGGSNTTGTISLNQWSHIAVVRQSSTFKVYINGNGETVTPPAFTGDGSSAAEIGRKIRNTSEELTGFISNLRVVKGTAVYTSNFTAPSEPLTNVTNTKLLCCNSSTSATASTVTPATITANGGAFATRNELSGSIVLAVPGASLKNDIDLDDTELIDNTGWVDYAGDSATVTVSSGTVTVDNGAANVNGRAISAAFNTTVGQSYKISFKAVSNTGGAGFYTEIRQSNGFGSTQVFNAGTTLGFHDFSFVATETAHTFTLYALAQGGSTTYSDISIKETNNLIGNGSFNFNTTGWTAGNSATLSVESGRLKVTNGTSSAGWAYKAITVVVGKRYTVNLEGITGTSAANIRIGTSANSASYGNKIGSGLANISLTATSTTLYVTLKPNSNTNGNNALFDNVVVKQEDAPRDYSADIKGSGTNKTPTLSGRSGVGYELGGYYGSAYTSPSNDDFLEFPGTSGDFNVGTGDFTIEMWLNPDSTQASNARLFGQDGNSAGNWDVYISSTSASNQINMMGGSQSLTRGNGSSYGNLVGDQWNHFCLERYNGQLTTYVNGVASYTQSYTSSIGDNNPFRIGQIGSNVYGGITYGFNGEIQDFRFYKGVSKYKGGFDIPKPYTPVGIQSWRQVPDTCKNNFATLNSIDNNSGVLSNGNLTYGDDGSDGWNNSRATIGASSGKWYWEVRADDVISAVMCMSVAGAAGNDSTNGARLGYLPGQSDDAGVTYYPNGRLYHADSQTGGQVGWGASYDDGDIISIALDMDDSGGKVWFAKNNSWQGSGNPATGTNPARNNLKTYADTWFPISGTYFANTAQTFNFGQNPTFSGQITAGTYTDSNGKGLFKYQPPTGFLALCEDNLPTPAIADPGDHFKTVLWTGVDGTNKIKCGFQPDFVWIKNRDYVNWHALYDSIRGPYLELNSNTTSANRDRSSNDGLRSFDSDGFTSGLDDNTGGRPGDSYVAWCWKAGGAAVSNTDGTITSQVSANQTAGFSIVKWTSNGNTSVTTMGHGLAKTPKFMLLKRTVAADNWFVYHSDIQTNNRQYVQLNTTSATITSPNDFWSTSSSTFGIRQSSIAANGQDCIAYCWAEIEGFSKFGSYDGNGNANGPFVYCGFKPAWIMIKPYGSPSDSCYSGGYTSWSIYDSSRSPVNDNTTHERVLFANRAYEEGKRGNGASSGAFQNIDFVSNGFKIRGNSNCETNTTSINGFLFVAFAESPFQTANAK